MESLTPDEVRVTVAAATYLALGRTRPAALTSGCFASYASYFELMPEDRPSFLCFWSGPAGSTRRYQWLNSPSMAMTAPYTKVELAGPPLMRVPVLVAASATDIRSAELAAESLRIDDRDNRWHEARRPISAGRQQAQPEPCTKLGAFCWDLGNRLWERVNDSEVFRRRPCS
jgi:hypothetical protein